ncbi:MAG: HAD family hydrolase [Candidatus Hydrogenedentes bacterium]|nr:HAD family hydrolase [Candidatus Hydrogenedentota bacterium]
MSNKALHAIIFDFDGLILDTESALFASWQHIFHEYGHPFPLERWAANVGGYQYDVFDPLAHLDELLGTPVDRDAVNKARREWYLERVHHLEAMPGVREAITTARSRELRLAIASSSSRNWVSGHLERLGLLPQFNVICCGDEVDKVKPDPALYYLALERLGLGPDQLFVLEDSPKGIAAARAASLYCVAVPNPVTRVSPLDGCSRRIESLASVSFSQLIDETEKAISGAF